MTPSAPRSVRRDFSFVADRQHVLASEQGKTLDEALQPYAEIVFHPAAFFRELFYHTLQPLPIILLAEGYTGARNRKYLGHRSMFSQWLLFGMLVTANVLFGLYPPPYLHFYELLLLDLLWLVRNSVVAIKYSYCSSRELSDMRTMVISEEVHLSRQLLTGWAQVGSRDVDRQFIVPFSLMM